MKLKLFQTEEKEQALPYVMNSGRLPIDGPRSALAGIAEKGARLDCLGHGSFTNVGSRASPRWVKMDSAPPTSSAGDWHAVDPVDSARQKLAEVPQRRAKIEQRYQQQLEELDADAVAARLTLREILPQ